MFDILDPLTLRIMFQIFLAAIFGMAVGFEREYHKKSYGTAGIRTLSLVAMGAALFTILSVHGFSEFVGVSSFDPSRIAGQVVVGIGFLGAGLVFLSGDSLRGLTTAATVWVVAAIGMAVGLGFYAVSFFVTILALIILWVLRFIDIDSFHLKRKG